MSYVSGLRCISCGRPAPLAPFAYVCSACGGFLSVEYAYDRLREALTRDQLERRRGTILEQWLDFLPIERPDLIARVTLGEQPTPMTRAYRLQGPARHAEVWLKNDALFPTCSLKDRSMPLVTLKALELGRTAVGIVSSGNAAASLAAYAARADLHAIVFLSKHVSQSKLYKTMVYKPVGVQVLASYSEAEAHFQRARDEFGFFDCNGLVNPYRAEGKKTFAYEVARDLGWRSPAAVFMPTAYGNGIVAAWKGFKELKLLGFIDSLPAMVAVQPAVIAPIARAYELGQATVEAVPDAETLAEAVAVTDPVVGGRRVLETVRESGGKVIAVTEAEIADAMRILAEREGLAMEPAGVLGLAGMLNVIRDGNSYKGGSQVISLTGHGLNDQGIGGQMVAPPLRAPADYEAVRAVLRQALGK